jgi:peptide subunit release factor 1 (eRF1)
VLCASADDGVNALIPTLPLRSFLYRCDKRYHLSELASLFIDPNASERPTEPLGVVLVSGQRAELYTAGRRTWTRHAVLTYFTPNQHKTGGQSAQRFERLRDEAIHANVSRVVERALAFFARDGNPAVEAVVVAGPAEMKEAVVAHADWTRLFGSRTEIMTTSDLCWVQFQRDHVSGLLDDMERAARAKDETELMEWIQTQPDRLMFGREEVMARLGDCERVWMPEGAVLPTRARTRLSVTPTGSGYDCVGLLWW